MLTDKKLTTWLRRGPGKQDEKQKLQEAPEIDRIDLRKMLLKSIPPGLIKWNRKLLRIEETDAGLALHFADGQAEYGFDLIVGVDGAFSKTRNFLTSERPFYVGLGGWTTQIPDAEHTSPNVYKLANRGSVFAYSDGKSLSIQQLSSGSIEVATYGPCEEDYLSTCGFDAKDLTSVKQAVRTERIDWAPELLDAVEKASEPAFWRELYMLPLGFTWPHKKGVTLLGDAAHLMTPFAGIGVNTAFYDAMLLTHQLVDFTRLRTSVETPNQILLDDFVIKYEQEMFKHAHEAQILTEGSMKDMLFTPGAPHTTIESWVLRHTKVDTPKWSHPFLIAAVYVGYWIYKWFV